MMKRKMTSLFLCAALAAAALAGCSSGDTQESETESSAQTGTGETAEDTEEEDETEDAASADADSEYSEQIFAMDTYMTLTAYGANAEEAVEAGIAEIERLDALLSTGVETSEVAIINADGGGEMSEDTCYLVERSLEIYESTGGVYDITIYPVMDLWGFTTGDFAVPDEETLAETLALVDAGEVTISENEDGTGTISLGEGQEIDLGGIAKGYASGRVMEIFEEYGIESAVISLGGNVHVLGNKTDGSQWRVGVQDPEDDSAVLFGIYVTDQAVITSGGYERYFEDEETGITYHHIIDPETGYSANNGLISVTIVSEDSTLADGLSTSLFVMGTEEAVRYCEEHCAADGFDVVMETEDGDIYVTDTIEADLFDPSGSELSVDLHIIETQ